MARFFSGTANLLASRSGVTGGGGGGGADGNDISTLVDNGDGTFTHTANGVVTAVDVKGSMVDNLDGTFTFTDAGGTATTWNGAAARDRRRRKPVDHVAVSVGPT